jgi:hypothetical protein
MSNRRAISSTQSHSEAIRGHQRHSEALRGTQRHSKALRGTQTQSDAIRRNQTQSDAIRGTQQHSEGTQRPLRGHPGPETATRTQIASAIIGGATAARARPFCCAIVVRTSPSLSPLTTLAPPPSFSACPLRSMARRRPAAPSTMTTPRSRPSSRAARCARFACNQRALGGHQRALRGHAEAIRGTQWPSIRGLSEASQRHAERPSEAIRGQSEALTGHQKAIKDHPWQSFAISSTQAHSVAIKRAPGPKTATMAASRAEHAPCACACARVRSACKRRGARQSGARRSGVARRSGERQSGARQSSLRPLWRRAG